LFLTLVAASGWAQAPVPAYQRLPPLPGAPGGPLPLPGGIQGNGNTADQVRLQFPNTDTQVILKFYEQLTGKQMVYDNQVGGNISIDISTPVSRDEAIQIIETCLNLNGYQLVPTGGNIVKVLSTAKNARNYGVNIYSDITQIPDDVSIASVLFQLRYADAKDITATLGQYVSPSSYTNMVPLPGAIIITESTIMLRNIAKVIAAADVPPAEVESRFYSLQRANAKDVVDKLTKLFEKTDNGASSGTQPVPRLPNGQPAPQGGVAVPGTASGLSEDSIIVGKIKVDYDDRTNRIHVVARPINFPFIEQLITEYDKDIQFGEPVKRPLKYVDAADVLDVIVKAITEPGEKADEATTGESTTSNRGNTEPTNNTTSGGLNSGNEGGGGGGGLNITEGLETPEKDITPKAVTVGNTKIIADPRENTIIVLGNDEVKQKIFTLLDQLDVRAPQVMLSTVIGEYQLNNDSNFGVDYLLHYPSGPLANILNSGTSVSSLASGILNGNHGVGVTQFTTTGVTSALGSAVGAGSGFTAAIGAANSLDVIVNALESTGRFHITNRPMVYAANNKKAIIVSGEQIPVPTSTLSNLTSSGVAGSTAAVQSSIDYVQVALQLEVVPLINSDREVNLDILQKLDSPGATTNVGGSNVPQINTRYIRTNVSVPNKQTIVLGGLITTTISNSSSQLPFLGRIPVLGYLFGNKTKNKDRSELIILIRPVVTTSPSEMLDDSHVERDKMLVEPDIDSTILPKNETSESKSVNFRYEDDKTVQ
jgi:type II secretion system protein D